MPPSNPNSLTPFKPLAQVLGNETAIAAWLRRYQLEAALTALIRARLPRLIANQVRVTDLRAGQLELTVPSGTLATAVRQRAPELLAALASKQHEFNGIRVRVQPLAAAIAAPPPVTRRAPPATAPLLALAKQLPEGRLKEAVSRLAKRR